MTVDYWKYWKLAGVILELLTNQSTAFQPIRTHTKYGAIIKLCENILLPDCEDYLGHAQRDVKTQHLILRQSTNQNTV